MRRGVGHPGASDAPPRQHPAWALCAYALATLLGGALLAPPAYWLGRALVDGGTLVQLAPFGFPTYLRRCWLVLALTLAPWALRHLPAASVRWRPGAASWGQARAQLALGLTLGLAGVSALGWGLLAAGWLQVRPLSCSVALPIVLASLLSGAAVATLEELAFRGALLRAFERRLGGAAGAALQVFVFAGIHFVAAPSAAVPGVQVGWTAGLSALAASLRPFAEPAALAQRMLTLLAVGTALTLAARRAQSLWVAMGLHGAWVFGLRLVAQGCLRLRPADVWLDRELRSGLLPLGLALVTALGLGLLPSHVLQARGRGTQGRTY